MAFIMKEARHPYIDAHKACVQCGDRCRGMRCCGDLSFIFVTRKKY